ncbi:hypothetical protein LTR36_007092 [Oleoguttula mirabilis]|uniref:Uncharacterized protein n=1 Tax=Oleoguttula mirabilis TaxID=1507867 RepID=A0AAV9JAN0_9PEZI|nr:hypothetical protein LTR36_007092 [Oleoguttula mirabilis]
MPTTRSATKQPTLEEVKGTETKDKKANESRKRKAPAQTASSNSKKPKTDKKSAQSKQEAKAEPEPEDAKTGEQQTEGVITINRAPVLELWASCVAHFFYPEMSWDTCLSVGGAIATITAVAKGRSIGTMDKPEPGAAEERRQKRKDKAEKDELDEVEVMHFKLTVKDGQALVGNKPKKGNEAALRKKYGDEQYAQAKAAFEEALGDWKDKNDELNGQAFKMYEDFRPSIPSGQKGWGKKGQLNLQNVKDAVSAG